MSDLDDESWEDQRQPPSSGMPELRLDAYDGPLDLLLELARAKRVDLTKVSILALAEQFVTAVEAAIAGQRVSLATMGDWVVAAATLISLRSRLMLPANSPDNQAAEREADDLRRRLVDRAAIQALANWLERRPQLGRAVFARGAPESVVEEMPVADITSLLRACLQLLELPTDEKVYRPSPPLLWRMPEAIEYLRVHLARLPPDGVDLTRLVPRNHERVRSPLQRRAAVASTLLASLELAREGIVELEQPGAFDTIRLFDRRTVSG